VRTTDNAAKAAMVGRATWQWKYDCGGFMTIE